MDRRQVESEHFIERYLAQQLTPSEQAEFQRFMEKNPEILREIEKVKRLKQGLALLRDRGELDALIHQKRPRSWLLPFAAALVIALLGAGLFYKSRLSPAVIAGQLTELGNSQGGSLPIVASFTLMRDRGAGDSVSAQLPNTPSALEFRILPSQFVPGRRYTARLSSIDAGSKRTQIGEAHSLASRDDRYVVVYVDSQRLERRSYELALIPDGPGQHPDEVDQFKIDLN